MDAVTLTRQLVDIESITGNEAAWEIISTENYGRLGYQTKKMPGRGHALQRLCYFARTAPSCVVFSTHMDTVPRSSLPRRCNPHLRTRFVRCQGIIAAQIAASERLRRETSTLACSLSWEKSATAWERK